VAADSFMFASPSGGPLDSGALDRRHFKPLLEKAGLPRLRLYDLRHSALSLLADAGVDPKVIQERAGHQSVVTTFSCYVHACGDAQERAAAVLDRMLGGSKA
jgi:integrase